MGRRETGRPGGRVSGVFVRACARRTEVEKHRKHSTRLASGGGEPELAEDARDVLLDCSQRDHEAVRDPLVRAAARHQFKNLALPPSELINRIVCSLPREQRRDDDRVERRSAVADAPHGGREFPHVADAILEQVADAFRGVGEQLQREPQLDVLGKHQHAYRRVLSADLERCTQPFVVVRRRQPDVDDRNVRRGPPHVH